jgi:hypothetical protein
MAGDSRGFRLAGALIPAKQDKAQIKLLAPPSQPDQPIPLHLEGHATIDGQDVSRLVVPVDNMMQAFAYWHLVPAEELLAVVQPPRPRGGQIAGANLKLATTITAKFVADQLGLAGEKSDKFVADYVNQRLASFEKLRGSGGGNTPEAAAAVAAAEASQAMRAFLQANLSPQEAARAAEMLGPLFGLLERNVAGLLQLNVPQAKVQQAMPVLSQFVQAAKKQVYEPVSMGLLARQDAATKIRDLRLAAAKDLAPIVGVDVAARWAAQPTMGFTAPQPRKKNSTTAPATSAKNDGQTLACLDTGG